MAINLTESAIKEIKTVMDQQKLELSNFCLEITVTGSCSGPQYNLGFREKQTFNSLNETAFSFGDLEVIVHNRMASYLELTTVDYVVDGDRKGFIFIKPESGCGNGSCGNCGC